jgi:hypothetical protein
MTNTSGVDIPVQAFPNASMTGTSLSLCNNWTQADVTVTNAGNIAALGSAPYGYYCGGYWYPYYTPYWGDRRPIRLTMAEVERLRVAAKKDKALRETLEKFTDHIEVIVNFGTEK